MARFDWYQGTVRAEVGDLMACLKDLGVSPVWESLRKAPHGYAFGSKLADASGPLAQVWWGGTHAHPHAVITGESAQAGAELLRAELPDHSVARADVCEDYADPGAFDRLQGLAVGVARDKGVKVGTAGDHLLTLKGRTCYLGAPSSHTRLRLYDKAEELRQQFAQNPVKLAQVPQELARLEVQVRPQTPEAKRRAALVEPMVLMGSAAWTRELMRQVAGLELEPFIAGKVWRQCDDDRAYSALLAQYGGLLGRLAEDHGSFEMLGRQIGCDLAERREALKRAKR